MIYKLLSVVLLAYFLHLFFFQGTSPPDDECTYFCLSSPQPNVKYLSLSGNKQQLGNQLWALISGSSIARKLGRKFYVSMNGADPELLEFKLADVYKIFPRISTLYTLMAPDGEAIVPHNYVNGIISNTHYEDPLVHKDRKEQFLVLDSPYAQNARYFYDYVDDVRELLKFSDEIKEEGEKFLGNQKTKEASNMLCAHIRRRDFTMYNWQSDFDSTVDLIRFVAKKENSRSLVMFGDDIPFEEEVISVLMKEGIIDENSFASENSKGVDLYLSSKICSSVALTSQSSTYAFWLAFVSQNQSSVYFLHEEFDPSNPLKPRFDDEFPLSWKEVRLLEGEGSLVENEE